MYKHVLEPILEQMRNHPQYNAIEYENSVMTYQELDERSLQVAKALINSGEYTRVISMESFAKNGQAM